MSATEAARTGPFAGSRVLVPVTAGRPRPLVTALAELGADVRTVELARIERADSAAVAVDRLAAGCGVAWLAFTSSHAVAALDAAARETGTTLGALVRRHDALEPIRVAAVGPATATALAELGIAVDLVPARERSAAGLLAVWPVPPETGPRTVLVPHGDLAEPTLPHGLRAIGWEVETVVAYRNLPGPPLDTALRDDLAGGRVDVVLLTSGSVAERLFSRVDPSPTTAFVALGPRTAQAVAALGVEVDATSPGPETAGLVWAVATALDARESSLRLAPAEESA